MINEAKKNNEHYFDAVLISVLATLAWKCRGAGITLATWEVLLPFLVGVAITSILTLLRKSQNQTHSEEDSKPLFNANLICPVSLGFQAVCILWMLILFRKARLLQEVEVEQVLLTSFVTGVVIAFCFAALEFINKRIEKLPNK
mgnify:CR=1 FL=1